MTIEQTTWTTTKADLAAHYNISVKTLQKWVGLLSQKKNCPFSMEEYRDFRSLPPKWVEFIKSIYG